MDATTRRTEINLRTLGTGVVLFSLWSFVRTALTLFLFDDTLKTSVPKEEQFIIYLIAFAITSVLFILLFYIGISARSESKGKKKTILYLIVDGIEILLSVLFIVVEAIPLFTQTQSGLISILASIVIDTTLLICLIQVMYYAINLRRIRKNASVEEKGAAA